MTTPTIGQAIGGHAGLRPFEHQGRLYRATLITPVKMAQWEEWLIAQAQKSVLRLRKFGVPEADFQAAWEATITHTTSGRYHFFGPVSRAAHDTAAGTTAFTAIVLGCSVAEAEALYKGCPDELNAFMARVWTDSFPRPEGEAPPEGEEASAVAPPPKEGTEAKGHAPFPPRTPTGESFSDTRVPLAWPTLAQEITEEARQATG